MEVYNIYQENSNDFDSLAFIKVMSSSKSQEFPSLEEPTLARSSSDHGKNTASLSLSQSPKFNKDYRKSPFSQRKRAESEETITEKEILSAIDEGSVNTECKDATSDSSAANQFIKSWKARKLYRKNVLLKNCKPFQIPIIRIRKNYGERGLFGSKSLHRNFNRIFKSHFKGALVYCKNLLTKEVGDYENLMDEYQEQLEQMREGLLLNSGIDFEEKQDDFPSTSENPIVHRSVIRFPSQETNANGQKSGQLLNDISKNGVISGQLSSEENNDATTNQNPDPSRSKLDALRNPITSNIKPLTTKTSTTSNGNFFSRSISQFSNLLHRVSLLSSISSALSDADSHMSEANKGQSLFLEEEKEEEEDTGVSRAALDWSPREVEEALEIAAERYYNLRRLLYKERKNSKFLQRNVHLLSEQFLAATTVIVKTRNRAKAKLMK